MTRAMGERGLTERIRALEHGLLHETHSRAGLEALLHEDFEEIGPDGRSTSRAEVLRWLLEVKRPEERWDLDEFQLKVLASDLVLALYRARRRGGTSPGSRRSSLWRRAADGQWRLFFHQATPLAAAH